MHDVFICYATKDAARVNKIVSDLEAAGLKCWIAPRDIRAGRNFQNEITNAIDNAKAMLIMVSRGLNESTECINEITVAKDISPKYRLIPVRVQDVKPERGYRYYLSAAQWVEHHSNPDATVDTVLGTLGIEKTSGGAIARRPSGLPPTTGGSAQPGELIEKPQEEMGEKKTIPLGLNPSFLLFDWNGRINRRMFVLSILQFMVFFIASLYGGNVLGSTSPEQGTVYAAIVTVLILMIVAFWFFAFVAILTKRIHDIGVSSWKVLLSFFGVLALFYVAIGVAVFEMGDTAAASALSVALLLFVLCGLIVLLVYPGMKGESVHGAAPSFAPTWRPYDPTLRVASASPEYDIVFLLLRRQGRISRLPYMMGLFFVLWLALVTIFLTELADGRDVDAFIQALDGGADDWLQAVVIIMSALAYIAMVYCLFAVLSKRLHDLGLTSWWSVPIVATTLVVQTALTGQNDTTVAPVVSALVSISLLIPLSMIPGASGFNRYGPPPGFRVEILRQAGQLAPA
ncbi:MAG: DUF805 domain-containing protein [Pseudomonadota bacterium]